MKEEAAAPAAEAAAAPRPPTAPAARPDRVGVRRRTRPASTLRPQGRSVSLVRHAERCASSSASAIPAPATPGTGTTSASWPSDAIARAHRAAPWRRRFQGEAAEATIGGERVLILKPQTYMNESGRAVARGAALLQDPARRRDGLLRRARPAAGQAAGEGRRRQCRP